MDIEQLKTAIKAVQIFAETHPRPVHVSQTQAAKMLGISRQTISKMLRNGTLSLNKFGLISITEIDRALYINPNFTASQESTPKKTYQY